ncbi:excalibur calcium-binding domain-containing protein [Deinococcus multiflagellatus]|uniref:Excalibur calcium-binding domain-containing protein n=1 Tax=Deinococcus multiflagellatus TaxID=1656887 RepID=A0ABW1ZF22_9DEIO|nr:excalibur calcium-binding domain-containing protein [Deinococcus multiflagellatus]MBZ9712129.1 excalibur calcium-binding domain-containing protein [Deinococcus multiflagellatus]
MTPLRLASPRFLRWLWGWLAGLATCLALSGASAAPFVIETRLLGRPLSAAQKASVQEAAARVAALIQSPYEPVRVDLPADSCEEGLPRLNETVKRFFVFVVVKNLDEDLYGSAQPCELHDGSFLPIYGVVDLNARGLNELSREDLLDTVMHELLHALGVGTLWTAESRVSIGGQSDDRSFVRREGKTWLYTAPRALAAYRALGGQGSGIPLDPDAGHWAGKTVCAEILSGEAGEYSGRVNPVSPLTLAALEDLGYRVNVGTAAPFQLPRPGQGCAAQRSAAGTGAAPNMPAGGFTSCAQARAAGVPTPIRRGQPGYRPELDGDGDGLACETPGR